MNATDWELWKIQAIRAVGLEGHPRAEESYALAWKYGYEGGMDEVLIHLDCISEMILEGI